MKDLAGQRFGRLVAVRPVGRRNRYVVWECRCDCGNVCETTSYLLTSSKTRSCGCLARDVSSKDLRGQRFGKLTAIRPVGRRNRYVVWRCRCDCGTMCEVPTNLLTGGKKRSCGCARKRAGVKDLSGRRFGKLTAISLSHMQGKNAVWECRCDCGRTVEARTSHLTSGKVTSCGCAPAGWGVNVESGKRFGKLVVVEPIATDDARQMWACRCDCGTFCTCSESELATGARRNCGCMRQGKTARDVAGQRFGRLVALEDSGKRERGSVVWTCRCDCGNTCEATVDKLTSGRKRSCGCLRSQRMSKDIAGQRFGKLVAIEPTAKRDMRSVVWRCRCDCGRECERSLAQLRRRKHLTCGICNLTEP